VFVPILWRYRPTFQFILGDADLELTPAELEVDVLAVASKRKLSVVEASAIGKRTVNAMRQFVTMYDAPEYRFREKLLERLLKYRSSGSAAFTPDPNATNPSPYQMMFDKFYLHRRLFITENGYMGTGP